MSLLSDFLGTEDFSLSDSPMFRELVENIKNNETYLDSTDSDYILSYTQKPLDVYVSNPSTFQTLLSEKDFEKITIPEQPTDSNHTYKKKIYTNEYIKSNGVAA